MKNLQISIVILLIILVGIIAVLMTISIGDKSSSAEAYTRTHTKAICDKNSCQDYVIVCNESELVSRTPITGAVIQIDSDWEDPRPQELIDKDC